MTLLPLHHPWALKVVILAPGTKSSSRRNRPGKKIFPSSASTKEQIDIPGSVIEVHNHDAKRSGLVRLVNYASYIYTSTNCISSLYFALPHYYIYIDLSCL